MRESSLIGILLLLVTFFLIIWPVNADCSFAGDWSQSSFSGCVNYCHTDGTCTQTIYSGDIYEGPHTGTWVQRGNLATIYWNFKSVGRPANYIDYNTISDDCNSYTGVNNYGNGYTGTRISSPPEIAIINATMVSPNVLGIGVDVTYPDSCPDSNLRNITFSGVINGESITKTIDVTQYTTPGVKWGKTAGVQNQMFDRNGDLRPTTPLRINLQQEGVPRFTDNVNFTLTAIASYEGGSNSDPSTNEVKILLPTVLLHGYVTRAWDWPILQNMAEIKGYPAGNTSARSGSYGSGTIGVSLRNYFNNKAYTKFSQFLENKGYNSTKVWGSGTTRRYVTLWDPRDQDIGYSSLSFATKSNLDADFVRIYNLVRSYSYANKLNIIGHSTGGLTARYWAEKNGGKINKIITVGTPHEGITEFYKEAFSGRYSGRLDYITKSLTLPNHATPNLIQWFVPKWNAVDVSLIPNLPSDQLRSPYFSNSYTTGYNPQVKFYIVYGLWQDSNYQVNGKPSAAYSTDYRTQINWANANYLWYTTNSMQYQFGDEYVFTDSASAHISGPANNANFVRRGFRITYTHPEILNNANIRNYISSVLMN